MLTFLHHFVVHLAGWRLGPYVPTPTHVVARMLKLADVGPADVVYDLGCGDGRVVGAPYTDRLEPNTSHQHLTNSRRLWWRQRTFPVVRVCHRCSRSVLRASRTTVYVMVGLALIHDDYAD